MLFFTVVFLLVYVLFELFGPQVVCNVKRSYGDNSDPANVTDKLSDESIVLNQSADTLEQYLKFKNVLKINRNKLLKDSKSCDSRRSSQVFENQPNLTEKGFDLVSITTETIPSSTKSTHKSLKRILHLLKCKLKNKPKPLPNRLDNLKPLIDLFDDLHLQQSVTNRKFETEDTTKFFRSENTARSNRSSGIDHIMSNFTEDNQIISDFLDPNTLMENLTNSILFQSKDNLKLNDLNRLSVKGGKAKTAGLSNLGIKNTSYDQKENQIQNDNSSQVNGKNRTRSMDITKYIRMKTMLFNEVYKHAREMTTRSEKSNTEETTPKRSDKKSKIETSTKRTHVAGRKDTTMNHAQKGRFRKQKQRGTTNVRFIQKRRFEKQKHSDRKLRQKIHKHKICLSDDYMNRTNDCSPVLAQKSLRTRKHHCKHGHKICPQCWKNTLVITRIVKGKKPCCAWCIKSGKSKCFLIPNTEQTGRPINTKGCSNATSLKNNQVHLKDLKSKHEAVKKTNWIAIENQLLPNKKREHVSTELRSKPEEINEHEASVNLLARRMKGTSNLNLSVKSQGMQGVENLGKYDDDQVHSEAFDKRNDDPEKTSKNKINHSLKFRKQFEHRSKFKEETSKKVGAHSLNHGKQIQHGNNQLSKPSFVTKAPCQNRLKGKVSLKNNANCKQRYSVPNKLDIAQVLTMKSALCKIEPLKKNSRSCCCKYKIETCQRKNTGRICKGSNEHSQEKCCLRDTIDKAGCNKHVKNKNMGFHQKEQMKSSYYRPDTVESPKELYVIVPCERMPRSNFKLIKIPLLPDNMNEDKKAYKQSHIPRNNQVSPNLHERTVPRYIQVGNQSEETGPNYIPILNEHEITLPHYLETSHQARKPILLDSSDPNDDNQIIEVLKELIKNLQQNQTTNNNTQQKQTEPKKNSQGNAVDISDQLVEIIKQLTNSLVQKRENTSCSPTQCISSTSSSPTQCLSSSSSSSTQCDIQKTLCPSTERPEKTSQRDETNANLTGALKELTDVIHELRVITDNMKNPANTDSGDDERKISPSKENKNGNEACTIPSVACKDIVRTTKKCPEMGAIFKKIKDQCTQNKTTENNCDTGQNEMRYKSANNRERNCPDLMDVLEQVLDCQEQKARKSQRNVGTSTCRYTDKSKSKKTVDTGKTQTFYDDCYNVLTLLEDHLNANKPVIITTSSAKKKRKHAHSMPADEEIHETNHMHTNCQCQSAEENTSVISKKKISRRSRKQLEFRNVLAPNLRSKKELRTDLHSVLKNKLPVSTRFFEKLIFRPASDVGEVDKRDRDKNNEEHESPRTLTRPVRDKMNTIVVDKVVSHTNLTRHPQKVGLRNLPCNENIFERHSHPRRSFANSRICHETQNNRLKIYKSRKTEKEIADIDKYVKQISRKHKTDWELKVMDKYKPKMYEGVRDSLFVKESNPIVSKQKLESWKIIIPGEERDVKNFHEKSALPAHAFERTKENIDSFDEKSSEKITNKQDSLKSEIIEADTYKQVLKDKMNIVHHKSEFKNKYKKSASPAKHAIIPTQLNFGVKRAVTSRDKKYFTSKVDPRPNPTNKYFELNEFESAALPETKPINNGKLLTIEQEEMTSRRRNHMSGNSHERLRDNNKYPLNNGNSYRNVLLRDREEFVNENSLQKSSFGKKIHSKPRQNASSELRKYNGLYYYPADYVYEYDDDDDEIARTYPTWKPNQVKKLSKRAKIPQLNSSRGLELDAPDPNSGGKFILNYTKILHVYPELKGMETTKRIETTKSFITNVITEDSASVKSVKTVSDNIEKMSTQESVNVFKTTEKTTQVSINDIKTDSKDLGEDWTTRAWTTSTRVETHNTSNNSTECYRECSRRAQTNKPYDMSDFVIDAFLKKPNKMSNDRWMSPHYFDFGRCEGQELRRSPDSGVQGDISEFHNDDAFLQKPFGKKQYMNKYREMINKPLPADKWYENTGISEDEDENDNKDTSVETDEDESDIKANKTWLESKTKYYFKEPCEMLSHKLKSVTYKNKTECDNIKCKELVGDKLKNKKFTTVKIKSKDKPYDPTYYAPCEDEDSFESHRKDKYGSGIDAKVIYGASQKLYKAPKKNSGKRGSRNCQSNLRKRKKTKPHRKERDHHIVSSVGSKAKNHEEGEWSTCDEETKNGNFKVNIYNITYVPNLVLDKCMKRNTLSNKNIIGIKKLNPDQSSMNRKEFNEDETNKLENNEDPIETCESIKTNDYSIKKCGTVINPSSRKKKIYNLYSNLVDSPTEVDVITNPRQISNYSVTNIDKMVDKSKDSHWELRKSLRKAAKNNTSSSSTTQVNIKTSNQPNEHTIKTGTEKNIKNDTYQNTKNRTVESERLQKLLDTIKEEYYKYNSNDTSDNPQINQMNYNRSKVTLTDHQDTRGFTKFHDIGDQLFETKNENKIEKVQLSSGRGKSKHILKKFVKEIQRIHTHQKDSKGSWKTKQRNEK